jgi:hypothetical protein
MIGILPLATMSNMRSRVVTACLMAAIASVQHINQTGPGRPDSERFPGSFRMSLLSPSSLHECRMTDTRLLRRADIVYGFTESYRASPVPLYCSTHA